MSSCTGTTSKAPVGFEFGGRNGLLVYKLSNSFLISVCLLNAWFSTKLAYSISVSVGFIYFATWDYYADEWGFHSFHIGKCEGEVFAAATGCLILSSYLVLFILFYISTYKKPRHKMQKIANSVTKDSVTATATGRATDTLKSAKNRLGNAGMELVDTRAKGQWATGAFQRQRD